MKRSLWTAVLAAGVLLVAGCSSNNAGTGSAASTSSASSSAAASSESPSSQSMSSEAMTSASSESMTSESSESSAAGSSAESGSSGSASASVAPANLDDQTKTWFTTLCEGVAPIGQLANLDTSGQDAATAQQTGVKALQQFSTVLSDTSAKLKSTPPPTFEGGRVFANQVSSGLAESGPKLAAVAAKFAAISPSNTAALQQAFQGLSGELSSAIAPLQQLSQLPPDVSAAAKEIPACKSLGG